MSLIHSQSGKKGMNARSGPEAIDWPRQRAGAHAQWRRTGKFWPQYGEIRGFYRPRGKIYSAGAQSSSFDQERLAETISKACSLTHIHENPSRSQP
ncbi:hypothetical protein RY831_16090 [Noviherbaspirillum sp. CPCC 100848]|uniref:Uncharacterized protein n=1 Tax=Noviherbaspirillum album TaxID=3080276 RepID=A0ABU6JAK7_9BURK|nr:hypothetical protein [Noviherbaspirillum sp. CPCC 100848]MEC4720684.1 hypothetical protein [Noviherbaspirillum sp. CPCC 100848]